jgi:secondary thiamine-phosphate synthase enzyme
MAVRTEQFTVSTAGDADVIDITAQRAALERLIPTRGEYEHNRLNHDSNSHAHQRATVLGPAETVPVIDGRLALGTWQQLVLIDFDDRPRERTVVVQLTD